MKKYQNGSYTGERALYSTHEALLDNCRFFDGESPLKESSDLVITNCSFEWKYPLWYCSNVKVKNTTWQLTARSGVWYTNNIVIEDSNIIAPKQFRRCDEITLINVSFENAEETLWTCSNVVIKNVTAKGDYFGMNSSFIKVERFELLGNYAFDGGHDIEIHDSVLESKDAFWNCKNVKVYDSKIVGEYLGWNSENVEFINCSIESSQGFCYMKNVKLVNCKLINTTLCFEYCSDIDAEVTTTIDSIKNPISGKIVCNGVKELILDTKYIDPTKTIIEVRK